MRISQGDLHIFILGSYESVDGSHADLNRLLALESHLTSLGYDAFLAIHRNSVLGKDLTKIGPRLKTQELVGFADLNLFLFTKGGVRNGLVAELSETQSTRHDLTERHVALVERSLTLSTILASSHGGIMSIGPIRVIPYDDDQELLVSAQQVAYNYFLAKRDGTGV